MAEIQEKYLAYRGDLQAVVALGSRVVFATRHPEKYLTPLYQLDLDGFTLSETPLPDLATVLCAVGESIWVGTETGQVLLQDKLWLQLENAPVKAIAALAQQWLAVLQEACLSVIDTKTAKVLQQFALEDKACALAVDATGLWLVLGNSKGLVQVYECESQPELMFSSSEQLHEGAVTALSFMPDEPRFLSAGSDNRLLSTHARGKLEPEDRARGAGHEKQITAILQTQGERFITGSRDQSCKCWIRNGGTRPATFADNTGVVLGLCIAHLHERPYLVVASEDRMRMIALDAEGKFGNLTHRFFNVYELASHELKQNDAKRRQQAIMQLAGLDDGAAIKLLTQQAQNDSDFNLRKLATECLGKAKHAQAQASLEGLLRHQDAVVRVAAFEYLRDSTSEAAVARPVDWLLKLVDLSLKTAQEDLGRLAVAALEPWAAKDDRALSGLIQVMNAKPYAVRCCALLSLEKVHQDANLLALSSSEADVRCATLVRMLQRDMLALPRVQSALRRRLDDASTEVRQKALLVSIASRPALAKALRERDVTLHKQLFELEHMSFAVGEHSMPELPKIRKSKFQLETIDYEPLLQASAALALDVSAQAAYWLALLQDTRAFGLLLQLSRASEVFARVLVCHALSALGDMRAQQRLQTLLNDSAVEVRDAAYSALLALLESDTLSAVELGFASQHLDVRQRALQTLVKLFKDGYKEGSVPEEYWQLLRRALNDGHSAIRNEAFKSVLNTMQEQQYEAALRFVLNSQHADIRREVQTQLIAEANVAWAWQFLLELLNDPDKSIREQTLSFALKKTKGRDLAPLVSALQSNYPDTRMLAVRELVQKSSSESHALLLQTLNDSDRDVRQLVLQNLVAGQATPSLLQALQSSYPDVVLQAAAACARLGEAAALPVLLSFVQQEKPALERDVSVWQSNLVAALNSLVDLGDAACLPAVMPLLDSSISAIRQAAVNVVLWCGDASCKTWLQQALRHQDDSVKYAAALALAWQRDTSALAFVIDQSKQAPQKMQLIAALAYLGDDYTEKLASLLDDADTPVAHAALLTLLAQDYLSHSGVPARLLTIIAANQPAYRLMGAEYVAVFGQAPATLALLQLYFNRRKDGSLWTISADVVTQFSQILNFASPHLICRALQLLSKLGSDKQEQWDAAWQAFTQRYATELNKIAQTAAKRKAAALQISTDELQQIAFGTYCGLLREPMPKSKNNRISAEQEQLLAVRQYAIAGLSNLCQSATELKAATLAVLLQALGDTQQAVRLYALQQLQYLGMDNATLAAECLETGYNDLGVSALEMLVASGSAEQGVAILQQTMVSRNDGLALEAANLLLKKQDVITVANSALNAIYAEVRLQSVSWLAEAYQQDAAKQLLYGALAHRYADVREKSAQMLAFKRDAHALPALNTLFIQARQARDQVKWIELMAQIKSAETADLLLQRMEHDAANNAAYAAILSAVGNLRETSVAVRVLAMLENKVWRNDAYIALLKLSGFDQNIHDPNDSLPNRDWMQNQLPRHDGLLAKLAQRCLELGETDLLQRLVPLLRWALSDAVDDVLATLCKHSQEDLRRLAVDAMGWRVVKRASNPQPVLDALAHKDPYTQFYAAYQLAHAGKSQGITVLLSSVHTLDDLNCRKLAVIALGMLADPRALDTLLTFANDDVHALQETAAEAIGHLGKTDQAEAIFALLKRFVASERSLLIENALKGLRYFDSREGWALVRDVAIDYDHSGAEIAIQMLGYDTDAATKSVLLDILSGKTETGRWYNDSALVSARRVFADDDLSPEHAYLSSSFNKHPQNLRYCLERVVKAADVGKIFAIYAQCQPEIQSSLARCILDKTPAPVEEALLALANQTQGELVQLAASVLGYADTALPKATKQIEVALQYWFDQWQTAQIRQQKYRQGADSSLEATLHRLIWLAGKLQLAENSLLQLAQLDNTPGYQAIRQAAFAVLNQKSKAVQALYAQAVFDNNRTIRQFASQARPQTELAQALSDRRVYLNLAQSDHKLEAQAVKNRHQMGIVLNRVVKQQSVDALLNTAQDKNLDELVRLNAIQALAQVATEPAESALTSLGKQTDLDEDLRKMAWTCLKRSRRLREGKVERGAFV